MRRYVDEEMKAGEVPSAGPGILNGWGGVLFTLAHLVTWWREPDLLQTAHEMSARAAERATEIEACDLGHGKAGSLAGLLALQQVSPDRQVLNAALHLGDSLMQSNSAISTKDFWLGRPFAPFWHGRLGVAWALLELAAMTGKGRYRRTALRMVDLELASDLSSTEPGAFGTQECVPGIALGCLRVLPYVDDAARRSGLGTRIEAALETMLSCGFGRNHTLGFGDMGCLEILLQPSEFSDDERWRDLYANEAAKVLAEIREHGWSTAIPLGVESPGLMTGLSGIGYGLLRLAAPHRVPSVLALHLPRTKDR
jgi:lantibiotic modifying enzyme